MPPKNPERNYLADKFEADRSRLRGVAYRMLGSLPEAEDAVQEAWLVAAQYINKAEEGRFESLGRHDYDPRRM